jgi:hypothetical protein
MVTMLLAFPTTTVSYVRFPDIHRMRSWSELQALLVPGCRICRRRNLRAMLLHPVPPGRRASSGMEVWPGMTGNCYSFHTRRFR